MDENKAPEDGNAEIVPEGPALTGGALRRLADSAPNEITLECAEDEDGNPLCSISMEDWARAKADPGRIRMRLVFKVAPEESKPSDDVPLSLSEPSRFEKQQADGTDDEA